MNRRLVFSCLSHVLIFLLLLSVTVPVTMGQANVQGKWSTLSNTMPINPIHAALLSNGKVLVVAGSGNCPPSQSGCPSGPPYGPSNNSGALLWDPVTSAITQFSISWDMFCNGMVLLQDGRALIDGGTISYGPPFTGEPQVSIFDPSTNTFTNIQNMARGRWYPTVLTLGDGRVMTFSGLNEVGSTNLAVEFYTVGSGWSQQYFASWTPDLYPRLHLLPDGKVFYSGRQTTSKLFDPSTMTWNTNVAATLYGNTRTYGSSVLLPLTPADNYDPKVIIMGGHSPATNTTEIIDMGASTPAWQSGPNMSQPRIEMNAVILPDGRVLAVGGSLNDEDKSTASLNADLLGPDPNNPGKYVFSPAGANTYARLYHSVALLLPDATIWLAGGNPSRGSYVQQMEIYQPPYLFDSTGGLATRPSITSAPNSISYGNTFTVQTPDAANISRIVLVRNGTVTHAFGMDQREVEMSFTAGSGALTVTAPPNGNIVPPGYYMLFILNNSGVPSVASFVQVIGQPDFSVAASPALLSVSQGKQGTSTISTTISGGFNSSVSLSASDVPTGTTVGFNPSTIPAPGTGNSTVTITVGLSTPTGTYPIKVGGTQHTATVNLTVTPAASPTPVFSPTPRTYTSPQSVTITDTATGAAIYYTTDGTMPTTSSILYSGAITVSATETIKAIAVAPGLANSAVATATYTIAAATPVFSPTPRTYTSPQSVTITDTATGAAIYYTTDGTTPTTSSVLYSGAITVSATETIKAIAVAPGLANSAVATATYIIAAATPVFSPTPPRTYTSPQPVTITDTTTGAAIYYTTDGTTPTTSSILYSGAITVSATETIKAIAVAPGLANSAVATATYTIAAATPVFSPTPRTYTSPQSVTITDTATGAAIYYTTDGTTPTTSSVLYSGAITVSATETIKAIAVAPGLANSAVATATYTIAAATPVFLPTPRTYTSPQSVTITDTAAGAAIYYTTNGTTPTTSSILYSGAITVSATETIKAIAVAPGLANSAVATATYTIAAATPVFSPTPRTYTSPQSVTITDTATGAAIYYTTDGTTPTTSSILYSGAITVSATETIKAIAAAPGLANSAVATATYTIAAATPVFSPTPPRTYTSPQPVTITDTTTGAAIYYTTDGTTPTTSSILYSGAITVSATETIKAIAAAPGLANSAVATATYTIAAATPVFSPTPPRTYTSPQPVTITDTATGAAIYYTTDGTTPTTSSILYSGAITVSATETIKAIAVAPGLANSAVATATYTIAAATPVFSPTPPRTYTSPQPVTITDTATGAAIYYTTDGTTPTTSSILYSGAITVSATETIKAIAVAPGLANSAVATATYTIQ